MGGRRTPRYPELVNANGMGTKLLDGQRARAGETIAPAIQKDAYHCPYCAVFAPQVWTNLSRAVASDPGIRYQLTRVWLSECSNCNGECYWLDGIGDTPPRMLYPGTGSAPAAHPLMPPDVREDYNEAREIFEKSPRGAAALLRLAVQKLMPHLGQPGKMLNDDIAALVRDGLDVRVQKALDSMRVIGNNAVHPGEMAIHEVPETAAGLFTILNYIVEQQIALPARLDAMYDSLPEGARDTIEKRDGGSTAGR